MIGPDIEEFIAIYGEQHRHLIEDALQWLNEREIVWGVTLNRSEFVRGLISNLSNGGVKGENTNDRTNG